MKYHFFDYKYNIQGFTSDFFSKEHIVFIILAFLSVIPIAIFSRGVKKQKTELFLKIASVCVAILEITKISWESYYDVTTGRGFNTGGLLPIYTCSLFIYTMLVAAFAKGKAKEYSLSFLTTTGLLCGGIGVVYCNGLNYYPFWTFGAFYSMFFHYSMFFTGVYLLASGYKTLDFSDAIKAFIPVVLISVIAIPVNYILSSDYMLLYSAGGVPLMSSLAEKMGAAGIRWLFTIIMLLTYVPLSCVAIAGYKAIKACPKAKKRERA